MRITNGMVINTSLLNLSRSFEKLQSIDEQVQTGKKISKASQNPLIASKSIRYNTRLYEIDQYSSNVSAANSWLTSSESTLGVATTILQRIRELVNQLASETLSSDDRKKNNVEIKELRNQLTQESNVNIAGRHLLAGYKTDEKVIFDKDVDRVFDIKENLDYKNVQEVNANESGTQKKLQY